MLLTMPSPYDPDNNASRQRLENLATRLSDGDLARVLSNGWTVASLFAHLCFLDRRVLVLLQRWKATGVHDSPLDSYAMNEASKPIFIALDSRTALRLCLDAAIEVDAEISGIGPELIEQINASKNWFRLNRALHRNHHLDQIEQLLF